MSGVLIAWHASVSKARSDVAIIALITGKCNRIYLMIWASKTCAARFGSLRAKPKDN